MKTIVLILIFSLMLVACEPQKTETPVVDDVSVELVVEPDPPTAGETTLIVTVKEQDGTPIDGATVAVHGDMDHEGMVPVDGESAKGTDGNYRVPFEWTMGGGWILDVTVTLPDNRGVAVARFDLNVGAISSDSIINRGGEDTADMDHEAMSGMSANGIHYKSDNDPALAGDATITITVTSAEGTPIDDAQVEIVGTMPEHEMMPITGAANSGENGRYLIPVRWTMAGDWQVAVTVTFAEGDPVETLFDQQVMMPEGEAMDMDNMEMTPEDNE
jgi:hypothetical protein